MSRVSNRKHMDEKTRLTLAEEDLDEMGEDVKGLKKMFFTVLASTTTASVLLAIDILIRGIGNNG